MVGGGGQETLAGTGPGAQGPVGTRYDAWIMAGDLMLWHNHVVRSTVHAASRKSSLSEHMRGNAGGLAV